MTVGNVRSSLELVSKAMAAPTETDLELVSQGVSAGNTDSFGLGFADVIGRVSNTAAEITATPITGSTSSSEDFNISYEKATQTGAGKEKVEDTRKETEVTEEDVEAIESDIRDVVKEALDVDDEELDAILSELGINVLDLLNPTNLVNLIAEVNNAEVTDIVMSEDLSGQLQNLMQEIEGVVKDFAMENQIPAEIVADALQKALQPEVSAEDFKPEADANRTEPKAWGMVQEQPIVTTVVDAATGKEIKITVRNHVTTIEEVNATELPTSERILNQPETKNSSEFDNDGKGQENKSFGEQLLANLSEAVTQTNETVEGFAPTYTTVNASDVINQMMDAIKVNVSNTIQSMEIQLTPENLGKLNLTVVAKDGMITASITAQNEAVRNALETQMISLKNSLNEAGLKVDSVEVTVAEQQTESNLMNQNGQGDNNDNAKSNARRRFRGVDEIPGEESEETANTLLDDGNSINVTA